MCQKCENNGLKNVEDVELPALRTGEGGQLNQSGVFDVAQADHLPMAKGKPEGGGYK